MAYVFRKPLMVLCFSGAPFIGRAQSKLPNTALIIMPQRWISRIEKHKN
jgi:hypothetical protein